MKMSTSDLTGNQKADEISDNDADSYIMLGCYCMFSTSTRIPSEPRSKRTASRTRVHFLFSLFSRLPYRLVFNNKPSSKLRHKAKRHTRSNHNPVYCRVCFGKTRRGDTRSTFSLFFKDSRSSSTTCARQLEQIPSLPAFVSIPFSSSSLLR